MFKSYFCIAWRNIIKHKVFSLINIGGLAVGIAACTIIFLYVKNELTYDQFNEKSSRIVRVTATLISPEGESRIAASSPILAPTLREKLPEIENAVRIENSPTTIKIDNQLFREKDFYKADTSLFSIFDFDFLEGSAFEALKNPDALVLTRSIRRKYFGEQPVSGKTVICDNVPRIITAVVSDLPSNSDLRISGILSGDFDKYKKWLDDISCFTFVLFKHQPDLHQFSAKLDRLSETHIQPELNSVGASAYKLKHEVEMLKDVHFSKGKLADSPKGDRQYSLIFTLLAVFILLIAVLNYINLTTAKSFERAREVGIRKVIGAKQDQLVRQFLFESFLIILIAWCIGIALVWLGLPYINNVLEYRLNIELKSTFLFSSSVLLISFLLAGFYPAFVMSAYKPIAVLKGRWQKSFRGLWLRKFVTVTQFAITAGLIMGTTVIYQQMQLLRNKDLGYEKDQLMAVYLPSDTTLESRLRAFQHELRSRPEVINLTASARLAMEGLALSSTVVKNDGMSREFMCNFFGVDTSYLGVYSIPLVEGRNFSDKFVTDKTEAFIVNESFVRSMGWTSALGKELRGVDKDGKIIGVVKDYAYKSLHNKIEPLVLTYGINPWLNSTTIKINPKHLAVVENTYRRYFPELYFDYVFLDEMVNQYYRQDKVTMSLFNQFTLFAIFVSCLGLYGLVSLIAVQRAKEISVRKVLGANIRQLFALLTKDFAILIIVALFISLPLMTVALRSWLQAYPYHVSIGFSVFIIPTIATFLIALAVVSREIIRASLVNPVKSLGSE
ncbi:ABC transporter permease [Pollutibacter soli]|uniref:ABC transporter permease n=1 Tax=Pollutibacter soli TaxID=3034157 RepID=UPI003013CAB6